MNLTTSASSAVTLTGTSSKRGGSRRVPARRVRAASVDRELGELQGDIAVNGRDLVEDPERRVANPAEGRLDAGVHALAACWAVHVRGVAGEEHAALAVAVGEPVVDAKPRTPHDVLDQRGSLLRAARVQQRLDVV